MSSRNKIYLDNLMLSRTSIDDSEKLCNLDVFGAQDVQGSHKDIVHNNFKQQLRQISHETKLLCKHTERIS